MQNASYLEVTARTCSISYRRALPAEELQAVLTGTKALDRQWVAHFATLFAEVPHGYLAGCMQELGVSLEQVERVQAALPPVLQSRHFGDFVRYWRALQRALQVGQLRQGRPEDGTWPRLFRRALAQLEQAGICRDSWTLGGGMGLHVIFAHRESRDVDIFFRDVQLLAFVSPRINDANEDALLQASEAAHCIRLSFAEGEVDFLVAAPLTDCVPRPSLVAGERILVDDPLEILAKKIVHRADEFAVRDLFDLAFVYDQTPERLLAMAGLWAPHLATLSGRIHALAGSDLLEEQLERLALRPNGLQVRGREYEQCCAFLEGCAARA